MGPEYLSEERARWLARHILPQEGALRAWLRARVGGLMDVDDVVQESYAVLAGLESVDHIRDCKAYLFQVARSVMLQQIRRNRVVKIDSVAEIEALSIPAKDNTPERATSDHQRLRRVSGLIARLPAKCRQAFVLRKVHGYSQREIAGKMRIAESTVEKHLAKGLRLLMRWMADCEHEAPAAQSRSGLRATNRKDRATQQAQRED